MAGEQSIEDEIDDRRNSYIQRQKNLLGLRQRAYQLVFTDENSFVKPLLEDLAKFCRADSTTFNTDPRVHASLEGRREVWLRIQDHLKLVPDELWEKYTGKGNE